MAQNAQPAPRQVLYVNDNDGIDAFFRSFTKMQEELDLDQPVHVIR